eukprot:gnl/TRDRNA2_/TRDRNA2_187367_c0_seq1.p1 gnl/TRDRNA2_/TRDRNA2_187367_c0~~gnl/TRDRNA2_/TRDRNA2_187367_c0_seq1.p1  ORF type:complete len:308 (+),score=55.35 gnl/TRDRNA2_/TRDRNA2_187367_c0_seq1:51-974(+)
MRGVAFANLLVFVAQADVNVRTSSHALDTLTASELSGKLDDLLKNRAQTPWSSLHRSDLQTTMLGKSQHLARASSSIGSARVVSHNTQALSRIRTNIGRLGAHAAGRGGVGWQGHRFLHRGRESPSAGTPGSHEENVFAQVAAEPEVEQEDALAQSLAVQAQVTLQSILNEKLLTAAEQEAAENDLRFVGIEWGDAKVQVVIQWSEIAQAEFRAEEPMDAKRFDELSDSLWKFTLGLGRSMEAQDTSNPPLEYMLEVALADSDLVFHYRAGTREQYGKIFWTRSIEIEELDEDDYDDYDDDEFDDYA